MMIDITKSSFNFIMLTVSPGALIAVTILFLFFLGRSYRDDRRYLDQIAATDDNCVSCRSAIEHIRDPETFQTAVRETIKYENRYGQLADSKVKRMLVSSRDNVVRAVIMGALDHNPMAMLQGAVTWSLAGGIVSGISDVMGWSTKFY
jgi:hypothetical protein